VCVRRDHSQGDGEEAEFKEGRGQHRNKGTGQAKIKTTFMIYMRQHIQDNYITGHNEHENEYVIEQSEVM